VESPLAKGTPLDLLLLDENVKMGKCDALKLRNRTSYKELTYIGNSLLLDFNVDEQYLSAVRPLGCRLV